MVYSSIPAYLDPANWQQPQIHPQSGGDLNITGNGSLHQHQHFISHAAPPPPPPPPPPTTGSIRPGSMADRARMANVPMPEPALKCPRCESTNTKFCYFNNYSLSQPRHFCKTCRRYWTRGGALRNVPVGGGCRRSNKRSSSKGGGGSGASSSKSPVSGGGGNNYTSSCNTSSSGDHLFGMGDGPPLRFMAPLQYHYGLSEFGGGDHHHHHSNANNSHLYGGVLNSGLGGDFQVGGGAAGSVMSGMDMWRLQKQQMQMGLMGAGLMDSSASSSSSSGAIMYPFESGEMAAGWKSSLGLTNCSMITTQMAAVKMEEMSQQRQQQYRNQQQESAGSLARQLLMGINSQQNNNNNNNNMNGVINHHEGYNTSWGINAATGGGWTTADLSSFSSSSTSNNQL